MTGLDLDEFLPSRQHHLSHLLQSLFEFPEGLFGVAVGTLLNGGRFFSAALNQQFTLLLRLMTELQSILLKTLSLSLRFPLNPQAFLTDLVEILKRLLSVALMLFAQLTLEFDRLLIELLSALKGFLLQLLSACGELLFKLSLLGLHLLLHLRCLLTAALEQLLALLSNLFTHLGGLAFRLLTNGRLREQLFTLLLSRVDNLISLTAGCSDEVIAFLQQLIGVSHLTRHRFTDGIENLNGVLLVHEPPATEGNATALQHDLLELIELVDDGEADLAHRDGGSKAELKNLPRSSATTGGTM
ncbi:hypothetical protein SynA1825c_01729 [Synechococcus sp. A18-25c]|nr:hypothetical protein SynA1825c_01729 [Synechococcus sp. A18-25c]